MQAHFSSHAFLLCILKHPHHFFSCISAEVICEFFFASRTLFLAVVAESFTFGRSDRGLVSTESLIFHFLIRVWTLLIGILSSFDIFIYLFPVLHSSVTFTHRSFDNSLLYPWLRIQRYQCKGLSAAQKLTEPLYTHWLQADRSQVWMVTFSSHLSPFVSTCVHVIWPKCQG